MKLAYKNAYKITFHFEYVIFSYLIQMLINLCDKGSSGQAESGSRWFRLNL